MSTNPVNIHWVRGHDDNTGNEMADFLAKKGRDSAASGRAGATKPIPYIPPNLIKSHIRKYVIKAWEEE